jgi:hypothetical protein
MIVIFFIQHCSNSFRYRQALCQYLKFHSLKKKYFSVSGTGVDKVGIYVTDNSYNEMQSQVTYRNFSVSTSYRHIGWVDLQLLSFFTCALDGGMWSIHASASYPPGKYSSNLICSHGNEKFLSPSRVQTALVTTLTELTQFLLTCNLSKLVFSFFAKKIHSNSCCSISQEHSWSYWVYTHSSNNPICTLIPLLTHTAPFFFPLSSWNNHKNWDVPIERRTNMSHLPSLIIC